MREILFRGKRKDNGEWVEGSYYESKMSGCYILVPELKIRKKDGVVIGDSFKVYEVIPKTVGQYTGLTDKNGKKIFEGDIVRDYIENINNEYDYDCFDCGRVFWYQQCSRFLRTSKWLPDNCSKIIENREYEIIGNIHDNPELLKEGDDK